jgi:hypothetical protein
VVVLEKEDGVSKISIERWCDFFYSPLIYSLDMCQRWLFG